MRTLRLALCSLLALGSSPVIAANIQATPIATLQDTALVTISGELQEADAAQFRSAVAIYPKAIVAFESTGGNLLAGIEIGTQIRLRNYVTLVPDNTICASPCAVAWLGGTRRFMGRNSYIGFHAAYVTQDGRAVETGMGNAYLGAYLNKLGPPDRAVLFVTQSNQAGSYVAANHGGRGKRRNRRFAVYSPRKRGK
jgi:hypothetical protein